MIDWTSNMRQYFEFWVVSPISWTDTYMLDNVSGAAISKDLNSITLGSASFDLTDFTGENYIRSYLVAEQNGESERVCLGTHLVQSPVTSFNGFYSTVTSNAYTPLTELNENYPPMYYLIPKGTDITKWVYDCVETNSRVKTIKDFNESIISKYDYVANSDDTWLNFLVSVMRQNGLSYGITAEGMFYIYKSFRYDRTMSVYSFETGENSIILPSIKYSQDIYKIPNVVEVYTSNSKGYNKIRLVNQSDGKASIMSRGREIVYRETSPSLTGIPSNEEVENYAKQLMENLSTIQVELSFTHAYTPEVNIGDTVTINYPEAGLNTQPAKIISQDLDLKSGLLVKTTAMFEQKYWTGG